MVFRNVTFSLRVEGVKTKRLLIKIKGVEGGGGVGGDGEGEGGRRGELVGASSQWQQLAAPSNLMRSHATAIASQDCKQLS